MKRLSARKQGSWLRAGGGYIGPNPEGHYLVYSVHEGDPAYAKANADIIKERLAKAAGLESLGYEKEDASPWVLAVGGRFGRFEHIFVGPDAPESVKDEAENILAELEGYPVLDDERASECEYEAAVELWGILDVRERLEAIREANRHGERISIFAARHDDMPPGVMGYGPFADL